MKKENKKPTGSTFALAVILLVAVSASISENDVTAINTHPSCSDGIDNNGFDGIDAEDPLCQQSIEQNPNGESPPLGPPPAP